MNYFPGYYTYGSCYEPGDYANNFNRFKYKRKKPKRLYRSYAYRKMLEKAFSNQGYIKLLDGYVRVS